MEDGWMEDGWMDACAPCQSRRVPSRCYCCYRRRLLLLLLPAIHIVLLLYTVLLACTSRLMRAVPSPHSVRNTLPRHMARRLFPPGLCVRR